MRAILLLPALLCASPSLAAEATALSVEGLARGSHVVVRGQVLNQTVTASPDGRRLHTLVDVRVASAWRGPGVSLVRVIVPGGILGEVGQRVDGAPAFAPGEEVVLFLHRAEAGGHRVTGMAQGKFSVAGAQARPDLSHLRFAAVAVQAGERRAEAMSLAELERRVRSVP
jgi:hypothetical protein